MISKNCISNSNVVRKHHNPKSNSIDTSDVSIARNKDKNDWDNILGFSLKILPKEFRNPTILEQTNVQQYIIQLGHVININIGSIEKYKYKCLAKKKYLEVYTTNKGQKLVEYLNKYDLPSSLLPFRETFVDISKIKDEELVLKVTKCISMKDIIAGFKEARMHNKLYMKNGCTSTGKTIKGSNIVVKPYLIAPILLNKGWCMVFIQGIAKGETFKKFGKTLSTIVYNNAYKTMNILWSLGFVHGDLHRDNILYNKETGKVTLIDLEATMQVPIKYRDAYKAALLNKDKKVAKCDAEQNNVDIYPDKFTRLIGEIPKGANLNYANAYTKVLKNIAYELGKEQNRWIWGTLKNPDTTFEFR